MDQKTTVLNWLCMKRYLFVVQHAEGPFELHHVLVHILVLLYHSSLYSVNSIMKLALLRNIFCRPIKYDQIQCQITYLFVHTVLLFPLCD